MELRLLYILETTAIAAYSRLLLSQHFYARFRDFEYADIAGDVD